MTDALAMCSRLALSFSPPASFSQVLGPQVCATISGDVRHSSGVGVQGVLIQKRPVEKVLAVPRVWAHLFFWVQK